MNEQQSKQEQPFPFKFWAILISSQSLLTLVVYFFPIPNIPAVSPLQQIIQVSTALVGIAVAIGFWFQRRWGLWLYIALLAFLYVQMIALMVNERITTGALSLPGMRVGGVLIGTLFLIFFYNQRHQFK